MRGVVKERERERKRKRGRRGEAEEEKKILSTPQFDLAIGFDVEAPLPCLPATSRRNISLCNRLPLPK